MAAKIQSTDDPTVPIQARIPLSLRAKVVNYAVNNNLSLTDTLIMALERLVEEEVGGEVGEGREG